MSKNILILLLILTTSISAFAQGWVKEFPGSNKLYSQNIHQTADGNYLSALTTPDTFGSGLEAGTYLIKFDENGETIWLENIAVEGNTGWNAVFESPDGGYFLIGRKDYPGADNGLTHITKLNNNFEEVTSTFVLFNNNTYNSGWSSFIFTDNNHFHISGGNTSSTPGSIRKYDLDLNFVSEIVTPHGINDMRLAQDGDFIGSYIGGETFKMSTDGQTIWQVNLNDEAPGNLFNIHSSPDGNFMAFSSRSFGIDGTSVQIKIDSNGEVVWTKIIVNPAPFHMMFDQALVTDGFISTGQMWSDFPNENNNLLLLKTDFDGNVIWQKTYHVIGNELGRALLPTSDDGIIGLTNFNDPLSNSLDKSYFFRINSLGNIYDQQLSGKIGFDTVGNCEIEDSQNLENWVVSASNANATVFGSSDSEGNYSIAVPTGIFEVSVHPPNELWTACENNLTVGFVGGAQLTRNFPVQPGIDCPSMAVQTSFPIARPCFDNNTYYISYCNEGTITANEAYVVVTVEEELSYVSSSIPLTSQDGNEYTFMLGDIPATDCGNFQIDFLVDCETSTTETVCIESEIFPNETCIPDPIWNGAFVEGNVNCEGDSIVFSLINTGTDDMSSGRNFIVIEDALILKQGNYQLEVQGEQLEKFPANGSTVILEAMQEAFAPGDPYVKVWVEGCGADADGTFSTGFVNQFSLGDNNPARDVECRNTSGAYDPNDKQGFPLGYGTQHFIRENTDIEYLIRFQNTGNDTAFTVVLLDTIAPELDLATLRAGVASHDYEWAIQGGNILKVTFNSILLPDSTTNFDASNGFLEFTIAQQPDLPEGTIIKNDVGIYFDYNEVVMTNETFHTIGSDFIILSDQTPFIESARIKVFPNPFNEFTTFKLNDYNTVAGFFELYDLSGKLIFQESFDGNEFIFYRNNLLDGNYFYKISDTENGLINSGQLSIHKKR